MWLLWHEYLNWIANFAANSKIENWEGKLGVSYQCYHVIHVSNPRNKTKRSEILI